LVPASPFRKQWLEEIAVGCTGCALVVFAVAANQQWFDRHFLPAFFVSRAQYVRMEMIARVSAAILGLAIAILIRRPLARSIARNPSGALSTAFAIVLAFGASEMMLRRVHLRAAEEVPERKEPLRHLDARFGWLFVPSRVGYQSNNGRRVQYAFDGNGYRVPRVGAPVDFTRPSLVFTGESMMVGEKLLWRETIPAQTGALLGIQSANIAVSGYACDQECPSGTRSSREKSRGPRIRSPSPRSRRAAGNSWRRCDTSAASWPRTAEAWPGGRRGAFPAARRQAAAAAPRGCGTAACGYRTGRGTAADRAPRPRPHAGAASRRCRCGNGR
jgi:hypothetical protein